MAANGSPIAGQRQVEIDAMTSDRLDSWKEIAAYLRRSVRTVTRWESEEGLPVHRHVHSKAGSVFAYKSELDAWWTTRRENIERVSTPPVPEAVSPRWPWVLAGALCLIVVSALAWSGMARRAARPPARLTPLTTYPGVEGPPSLSPDGNQVAFERNGDIFVKQVDGEALVQLTYTSRAETAPSWSPDGRQIAFRRAGDGIFVISPLGGGERKIAEANAPLLLNSLAWTPDSRSLVVSEMTSPVCASLFVVAVANGEKTRLTSPREPTIGDGWPAVSPDGTMVAFARYSQDSSANVHVVPLAGGEPRPLTSDRASVFGIAWSGASEVVFASDRSGTSRLWSVSTRPAPAGAVMPVASGEDARFPAVSRPAGAAAPRLAYQRFAANVDIRRVRIIADVSPRQSVEASHPYIASTRSDDHPAYSADGLKIAFVSRRSGTDEIWVCQSDASNPVRLTSMNGPIVVAPRWSPDGRRIAFFAATGAAGAYRAYVVAADGGEPVRLTKADGAIEALPSWSRDGRWIYMTSGRSGALQIWKVDVNGAEAVQLTHGGGAEAQESPDGTAIYYAKVPEAGPGLWSVSPDGRNETRVLDSVRFGYWAVLPGGIYFIDFDVPDGAARPVRFFNFRSRTITRVGSVEATVSWHNTPGFAVSPDGRWLLYSSLENSEADLMLVDRFR
jgi:Tol biopolymer transport system component